MSKSRPLEWCFHENSSVSALVRMFPWETTSLGVMERWPTSWKVAVSICLASHFPMILFLGNDFVQVYNDAFLPTMGKKHPKSLGGRMQDSFPEVWDTVRPMLVGVMQSNQATWVDDQPLPLERHGYVEESYWTYSYSPLKDEASDGATGIFCVVAETTSRYLSDRRMRTVQNLSKNICLLRSTDLVSSAAVSTFAENPHDLPFSMIYLQSEESAGRHLRLAGSNSVLEGMLPTSINDAATAVPPESIVGAILSAMRSTSPVHIVHSEAVQLSSVPSSGIAVLPLRNTTGSDDSSQLGVLVVGLNPRRAIDEAYTSFLSMLGATLTSALVTARDHKLAQQRAEALTKLDRAKTAFFSNISHEFRTPLTLLLGPLEGLHESAMSRLSQSDCELLSLATRNARRLLKLVNTLLDFSRIEAGRVQSCFKPVNLAALTRDLASVFRAACEKATLQYVVECADIEAKVYVDTEMWEKIVLNLIGNAYKYTLHGEIRVSLLSPEPGSVELRITDTGCGIPVLDLPRIFDRFYRVAKSQGRTHEGTGIGLALVWELVQLHGGTIRVESVEGAGSTFFVRIPIGKAHLSTEHVEDMMPSSSPNIGNSRNWELAPYDIVDPSSESVTLPKLRLSSLDASGNAASNSCVLVVDDNTDMRNYITRILLPRYRVINASNGAMALEYLRNSGSEVGLVLTDIMMPVMGGFELLKAIRDDEKLHSIPVILLSARAGNDARAEGISAGADDYFVKPFAANELLVSVAARLELAQARLSASKREKKLYEEARIANETKDRFLAALSHELRTPLAPALLTLESLLGDHRTAFIRADLELLLQSVSLENQIIGDLLDLTRIRSGKLVLNKRVLNLNELVLQTVRLLQREIDSKKLYIELKLSAANAAVFVDDTRVQQILWNLLGNAIKFTPERGSIVLMSENKFYLASEPLRIDITVTDTGVGITEQMLPRIFDAFEQGHVSVTQRFGGLGLGLSIARTLALLHDGTLSVSSDGKDHGSSFTLSLPVSLLQPPPPPSTSPLSSPVSAAVSLSRKRSASEASLAAQRSILLVEDNAPTKLVMARMLSKFGYLVCTADSVASAKSALTSPNAASYDLLLSDLGLPDGSGIEVLQYAQSLGLLNSRLQAIALSGFGSEDDIAKSLEAGFVEHLTKPVSASVLQAVLRRVLRTENS